MSIKQNIKRRMVMVLALAMTVTVLAAGTAHAGTRAFSATLTNSASQETVAVGDTMHFDVMLTNNDSVNVSGKVKDTLPANVKFVSAYSPQGPCIFEAGGANGSGTVTCDPGNLAPGESTNLDITVVPQKAGIITNVADDAAGNEASASAWVHPAQNSPAHQGKAVAKAGGAIAIAG
jgi:uncharacterized repeat protein (TIGR01451 family)